MEPPSAMIAAVATQPMQNRLHVRLVELDRFQTGLSHVKRVPPTHTLLILLPVSV